MIERTLILILRMGDFEIDGSEASLLSFFVFGTNNQSRQRAVASSSQHRIKQNNLFNRHVPCNREKTMNANPMQPVPALILNAFAQTSHALCPLNSSS